MEPVVAVLVLVSATLHPIWNALAKRDQAPERVFFTLLMLTTAFAGGHALLVGEDLSIGRAWPYPLISAAGLALYGIALVLTLRRGDLSVYYPIIRSSPLFIVLVGVLLLGERYAISLLLGIALVLCGAFLLQYRPGARPLHDPPTLGLAVLGMAGSGTYSISDARGVQLVEPMFMFFWSGALALPVFAAFLWLLGQGRAEPAAAGLLNAWATRPWRHLAVGLLAYGSYLLLLTAYKLGGDVAAVTSVRQASIPISVLLGGLLLEESGLPARLAWSLLLAAGIVVIVLSC
jgi:drug/metabolite transporter (DMT)-like permease